jgi:hypothetical protein
MNRLIETKNVCIAASLFPALFNRKEIRLGIKKINMDKANSSKPLYKLMATPKTWVDKVTRIK